MKNLFVKLGSTCFILCTILSVHAHAGKYGTAGCGLGSMLFENKEGMVQILAATTNGTFGSQTFGITSGTSNCDGTNMGEATSRVFIETNREAIAKEIAKGQGETISSLTELAGCIDPTLVGSTLQQSFTSIFPNTSVSDATVSSSIVQILAEHNELSCKNL